MSVGQGLGCTDSTHQPRGEALSASPPLQPGRAGMCQVRGCPHAPMGPQDNTTWRRRGTSRGKVLRSPVSPPLLPTSGSRSRPHTEEQHSGTHFSRRRPDSLSQTPALAKQPSSLGTKWAFGGAPWQKRTPPFLPSGPRWLPAGAFGPQEAPWDTRHQDPVPSLLPRVPAKGHSGEEALGWGDETRSVGCVDR